MVADKIIFNIPDKKTVLFNFLQNLLGRFNQIFQKVGKQVLK